MAAQQRVGVTTQYLRICSDLACSPLPEVLTAL